MTAIEALRAIYEFARQHPSFDEAAFLSNDPIDAQPGGDTGDWTVIAMWACEGLADAGEDPDCTVINE